jgi:hypothetical protein
MSEPPFAKTDARKLAHAYIALAFAQDEAKRYVTKHGAHAPMLPLITSLEMTAELLEEVLHHALPEEDAPEPPLMMSSSLVM